MLVLGLDPSLTNFGWALHDTSHPVGDRKRCVTRGRFQTSSRTLFIDRYIDLRERLRALIREVRPDKVGIEYPVFNDLWSEGMYGLFLYSCEALKAERMDVVFWSPMQVKAFARERVDRPKGWKMQKADMVEAAKVDAGGGRWNHNEADAYHVARLAARFWLFHSGQIAEDELSVTESRYFTEVKTYVRGKKAGRVEHRGMVYREGDRFFLWSQHEE